MSCSTLRAVARLGGQPQPQRAPGRRGDPVHTEAEIRAIPEGCAWVLMPGAPLGVIDVADHQLVDPFASWACMSPVVDAVPPGTVAGIPDAGDEDPWWWRLQVAPPHGGA